MTTRALWENEHDRNQKVKDKIKRKHSTKTEEHVWKDGDNTT